jgi:diguanylate cyclase (GGDEF)-like protein
MGNVESFGVFVADINNLKITNDKYGHEIGNKLIIKVARVICDVFKRSPVYRIGGDEFAVLLRGADLENFEQLVNEMDLKINDSTIEVDEGTIEVSVARGMAIYDPDHDVCFEDIFERADKKMYENKRKKQSDAK